MSPKRLLVESPSAPPGDVVTAAGTATAADAPVLRTTALTRRFGVQMALRDADLELGRGEIMGPLGPNGAGKTTLLRVLTGLADPSAATVEVLGRPLAGIHSRARGRPVGFVPSSDLGRPARGGKTAGKPVLPWHAEAPGGGAGSAAHSSGAAGRRGDPRPGPRRSRANPRPNQVGRRYRHRRTVGHAASRGAAGLCPQRRGPQQGSYALQGVGRRSAGARLSPPLRAGPRAAWRRHAHGSAGGAGGVGAADWLAGPHARPVLELGAGTVLGDVVCAIAQAGYAVLACREGRSEMLEAFLRVVNDGESQ